MDLTTLTNDRVSLNGPDAQTTQRIVASVYRLLARGRPVEPRQVAAHSTALLADVERVLEEWGGTRRGDDGRVLAFGGLDLEPTAHRMEVSGTQLFTWCAWDTFFLPLILGVDATVESRPPEGGTVTLTVGPDGARDVVPGSAVLSLVRPDGAGDLRATFCDQVFLFADEAAGRRWADGRNGVTLVSLEEGARLGRQHAKAVVGELVAADGPMPGLLFDLHLQHDPPSGLEIPASAEGTPVGSGSGRVSGPVVNGSLRWVLSERVGNDVCAMNFFAAIDTVEGVTVEVEGQGFARLRDEESSRWEVSGALRLTSADPRFAWLGDQLATFEGDSDLSTGTAAWRARLRG